MGTKDLYGVLGVPGDATSDEIKRAFRAAVFECHPDYVGDDSRLVERFMAVQTAYEVLSDPVRRRQYDRGFDPIISVQDLFGRHAIGRRVMETMLPSALAESQPGADTLEVLRVPSKVLESGGKLPISIAGKEVLFEIPPGANATPWCCISGVGEAGKNGGRNGDCWILVIPSDAEPRSEDEYR